MITGKLGGVCSTRKKGWQNHKNALDVTSKSPRPQQENSKAVSCGNLGPLEKSRVVARLGVTTSAAGAAACWRGDNQRREVEEVDPCPGVPVVDDPCEEPRCGVFPKGTTMHREADPR